MNLNAHTVQMNFHAAADPSAATAALAARSAVATADAVLLGPLASTEAQGLLDKARTSSADDPAGALELYRTVQKRLITAGFPVHAAEFDHRVAALYVATGEEDTALRLMMDTLWAADTAGSSQRADRVLAMLRDLAGFREFGPTGSEEARTPALSAAFEIADFVTDHLHSPIPTSIELPTAAMAIAHQVDRARVVLFAAENALRDDNFGWITSQRELIATTAVDIKDEHFDLSVRLRLALADATGEWSELVDAAAAGMRRDLKALVLARHARHQLLRAAPTEALRDWQAAVGEACLVERHIDAADWLYSQRFVASRYGGPSEDKWHPLAQALADRPSNPRIVPGADRVREQALAALHYDQSRTAAINLRRHLLEGIRSASFWDEREARALLGEHYLETEELPLAAYYTIGAGDYKDARKVAAAFGDDYHDVTEWTKSPLSWVAASALQFITEQADLIPDEDLDAVVGLALAAINDVKTGTRLDSPFLSPQVYLSAYGLIATVAERLSVTRAGDVLGMLADAVTVAKHHYRRTDDSHIQIAAGVARAQTGDLRIRAVEQLAGLYERGAHPFNASSRDTLVANIDQIRDRLLQMARNGHREAAALLAYKDPAQVSSEAAKSAAQRLREPTTNGPNGFGMGTGAVNDSLLAATLPAQERLACIEMLLTNAGSTWEPATNRDSYLLAAANLVDDLDDGVRSQLLDRAIAFASDPPPSAADAFNAASRSPLAEMRVDDRSDCRPAAVYLAARLAKSAHEMQNVRDAALRLVGVGTDEDYRITKTLQLVQSELGECIGLLAQGSWTLRSLAAILWAESTDLSEGHGTSLSRDPDVRVRRALARAILNAEHRQRGGPRDMLRRDPRWSVRSILTGSASKT